MSVDLERPELDLELIHLNEPHELQYWKEVFDCDELALRKAVAAVGNAAENVRDFFLERN